jgi:hypothetical protein
MGNPRNAGEWNCLMHEGGILIVIAYVDERREAQLPDIVEALRLVCLQSGARNRRQ